MGRPTKYRPEMCDLIHAAARCAREGLTDKVIGLILGVSEQTVNGWKKKHPEFVESLKETKQEMDDTVQDALYQRAKGYSHQEEKVSCNKDGEITSHMITRHYPPDTGAAFIWLKNRQSQDWADVKENINRYIEDEKVSDLEIARRVADLLTAAVDPNLLN